MRNTATWLVLLGVSLATSCITLTSIRPTITLKAADASLHGRLDYDSTPKAICFTGNTDDSAMWRFSTLQDGKYTVAITYSSLPHSVGSMYSVAIGGAKIVGKVIVTPDFSDYVTEHLGTVSLHAGEHELKMSVTKNTEPWVMNLRKVVLTPVGP